MTALLLVVLQALCEVPPLLYCRSMLKPCIALSAVAIFCGVTVPASATYLTLGSLSGFALADLGAYSTTVNTGPITGNVLVGRGLSLSTSGGNGGKITGTIDRDSTSLNFNGLQTAPSAGQYATVTSAFTAGAVTAATSLASAASALTSSDGAVQTFANLTSATTITGVHGLNIINVTGQINNAAITFNGPSDAIFVINTPTFHTNQNITLAGSVNAANILWNITGTASNSLQTSGAGTVLYGTFLDTSSSVQWDAAHLNGELIVTGGNLQFVSGAQVTTQSSFVGYTSATPEPASWSMMLGAGLIAAGFIRKGRFQIR